MHNLLAKSAAWTNLCRVLGEDFTPFLSHVIPPLLKAAAYSPKQTEASTSQWLGTRKC